MLSSIIIHELPQLPNAIPPDSSSIENRFPGSEMAQYGHFIKEALQKTKGRACVPSLGEIAGLIRRQEMVCTVHCPGTAVCHVTISSHTTAQEVSRSWGSDFMFFLSHSTLTSVIFASCDVSSSFQETLLSSVALFLKQVSAVTIFLSLFFHQLSYRHLA